MNDYWLNVFIDLMSIETQVLYVNCFVLMSSRILLVMFNQNIK